MSATSPHRQSYPEKAEPQVLPDHDVGLVESLPSEHHEDRIIKPFTTLSAMSIGLNTTNSAIGVILTLSIWLPYGGPAFTVYSYISMALVGAMTAVSLSELASAMPDAGGQYMWVARLSPPRCRRFLSYLTALVSWAGAVCTSASASLGCPNLIKALVEFLNPGLVVPAWQVFLGYQAVVWISMVPSLFESALPRVSKASMFYTGSILSFIFIGLFAATKERQSAESVFTGFSNQSGWPAGVAVLIGMNSPNWCFSCVDAIVHIAEEIPNPRKNIPKAIMWTIPIALVTGLMLLFAALFCMDPVEPQDAYFKIAYTSFGNNRSSAIAVQVLIFCSLFSCTAHIHVWQSRLAWTIATNQGLPFAPAISKVFGPPFQSPVWATIFSAAWSSLLGVVYIASSTAFGSFISCGILFQYFSYCIPIIIMLLKGRDKIIHGPFWHPILGLFCNIGLLCWTVVATVFYAFPYYQPVVIGEMNYVSVILCGFIALSTGVWLLYARRRWTVPQVRDEMH